MIRTERGEQVKLLFGHSFNQLKGTAIMKQITVIIDEDGNSSIDLTGFTDGSCARTMRDFQGDDQLIKEHKKPEYYRHEREGKEERRKARL